MAKYAYTRVSSKDQNIAGQVEAMQEVGLAGKQMYIDKQSRKDFIRKSYQRLIGKLEAGGELYIKSIDHLGRDYGEILEQQRYLTRVKDVDMVVLDLPLLGARNQVNGVTGRLIAGLVLQIPSYVAQIERENTRQRQAEGIRIAKEGGVQFEQPKHNFPGRFGEIYRLWEIGEVSMRENGCRLNAHHATLARWMVRYQHEKA